MARNFNGTTDRIAVSDTPFDFERTDSFSAYAWIYANSTAAANLIITKTQTTGGLRGWSLGHSSVAGRLRVTLRNEFIQDVSSNQLIVESTNLLSINTWTHVAFTYDGTSLAAGVKIYINGVLETNIVVENTLTATMLNNETLSLGYYDGVSLGLNGRLAAVGIHNVVLTNDEIVTAKNVGSVSRGAVAIWPICGAASPESDTSGNNNNGTVTGTSCAAHPVPEQNCAACAGQTGTQRCSRLNIVMDTKRPHLVWIQDILGLYRSTIIWSNGAYKLISDRQDLPLRQVFHAGNTIPGRTEVRIGGDPLRPNQITADFLDQDLNYEREPVYVQNSASIVTANDPITNLDLSFIGLTRKSEVLRAADLELQHRRSVKREITWATGLEGLAVEPGDVAAVGVITTNWEMGFGGRALDGSSRHAVFDREVQVSSGYTYELLVWHTAADTPEARTVATSVPAGQTTFKTITVSPTSGFNAQVMPGDRLAMGITSEDLIRVRVTKVSRDPLAGVYVLTGEEFLPALFNIDCPGSATTTVSNAPPSQPSTASITASGCTVCANVITVPSCIGGLLTVPGTLGSVTLNSSHNPNVNALVGDALYFITGPASGATSAVSAWGGSGSNVATVANPFSASSVPGSGNSYYVLYRTPNFGGLDVEVDSGGGFVIHGIITATSGCIDVTDTANALGVRLTPFSDRGQRNTIGRWTGSVATAGCRDASTITDARTATGSATTLIFAEVLEGNRLGTTGEARIHIKARVTEQCSPANEVTDMFLGLQFGGQTLVDSLAIRLNAVASLGTIGFEKGVRINAEIIADNATNAQIATLKYRGRDDTGHVEVSKIGEGTVDSTLAQTMGVTVLFQHVDSASAVHSHGCFFLTFKSASVDIENPDAAE